MTLFVVESLLADTVEFHDAARVVVWWTLRLIVELVLEDNDVGFADSLLGSCSLETCFG